MLILFLGGQWKKQMLSIGLDTNSNELFILKYFSNTLITQKLYVWIIPKFPKSCKFIHYTKPM